MLAPTAVREVMQAPVETTTPGTPVRAAARQLIEAGVGSLVVCRDAEPAGIVTDVDLTRLLAEGADPDSTTVAEVMTEPLITVDADAGIEAAADRMRAELIKRLPVVEDGEVVGIVTTTDLSNFLPHLVRLGRGESGEHSPSRQEIRTDTAYENEDWSFEYLGHQNRIDVGDRLRFSKTVSAADVEAFAAATGDTNRLHLDEGFAAGTRFGRRIVHGTLVAGLISAALARLPGLTIYLSQDLSFLAPVSLDQRLAAECEVVERIGEGRFRLSTLVEDAGGEPVIEGEAAIVSDEMPDAG
jgi:CBS domain-containing protein/acyl dehydratase